MTRLRDSATPGKPGLVAEASPRQGEILTLRDVALAVAEAKSATLPEIAKVLRARKQGHHGDGYIRRGLMELVKIGAAARDIRAGALPLYRLTGAPIPQNTRIPPPSRGDDSARAPAKPKFSALDCVLAKTPPAARLPLEKVQKREAAIKRRLARLFQSALEAAERRIGARKDLRVQSLTIERDALLEAADRVAAHIARIEKDAGKKGTKA